MLRLADGFQIEPSFMNSGKRHDWCFGSMGTLGVGHQSFALPLSMSCLRFNTPTIRSDWLIGILWERYETDES